ncbi:MAG: type II toxin-antitoxin system RelE/ParE family toxin [Kiritimatiellae bacterium]|nr:type II toxin-antitoxin system RelE/ParE family toxin [Kiritimatiellia bacterium]
MLGEAYTLEYLPIFDEELASAVRYISVNLRNPEAAHALIDEVERAITDRLFAPESFEAVPSEKDREHPYYRIVVGNYLVLYCVIGKVMEVRRFVYAPSDWRSDL